MSIRKETVLPAAPERIYELLTDAAKFAEITGQPAQIEAHEGGTFSTFGGMWQGRQIELVPGERIVQVWRSPDWDPGVYSLVRLTLAREGKGSRLVVEHSAYPEGKSPLFPTWDEHLSVGWEKFYFETFMKYLSQETERCVI